MSTQEFNLFKLLEVIARRIKFIIVFVLIITLISVVISLVLPKWYQAKTLILHPKDDGMKLGLSGQLDDMLSLTAGIKLPVMATPADVYARILGSRSLALKVVEKNNLDEYYEISISDDLFDKMNRLSDFRVTPEGLLEISYMDKSPQMAAVIANSFAEELDNTNRSLTSSRAKIARAFIENRLSEVSVDLDSARMELRNFQNQNKAIDLDKQTQLAIESAIDLKVELARNEIDMFVKERSLSSTHPDVKNLRRRIGEIEKQINELEFGGNDSSYLNLPISEIPTLKIKYAELSGRVRISEALYQILSEQYEQAKIQEKMDSPTISIIDPAYPPELPVKPQKRIIVILTFIISLIVAILITLIQNYFNNLRRTSPEDYERAHLFFITFFGWLPGIKKTSKISE